MGVVDHKKSPILFLTPSRSQPIFLLLDVVRHPMVKMAVTFLYQPGFLENLAKVFKTKQKKMSKL